MAAISNTVPVLKNMVLFEQLIILKSQSHHTKVIKPPKFINILVLFYIRSGSLAVITNRVQQNSCNVFLMDNSASILCVQSNILFKGVKSTFKITVSSFYIRQVLQQLQIIRVFEFNSCSHNKTNLLYIGCKKIMSVYFNTVLNVLSP